MTDRPAAPTAPKKKPAAGGTPKKTATAKKTGTTAKKARSADTGLLKPDRQLNRWIMTGIVLVAFLVYIPSLGNGFVDFDDPDNIAGNPWVHSFSWANVVHWFTTPLQYMYTPLVYLSYAVDYQFAELSPGMYHFTNLALHLANVILVFLVIHALTRRPFVAHFVALAFALHPVNVDGVAWVSTRSNLLATLFSLLAIWAYLKYARDGGWRPLVWSSLWFLFATLSKSPAVVLPLVLFLVDYYLARPVRWKLLLEKIPFLVIAGGMGVLGLIFRVDTINPEGYNLLDRVAVVCTALVMYLVKLFAPVDLAFAYAYPPKVDGQLAWQFYLTPIALALLAWLLIRIRWARRAVVFGLGFFLVTILLSQTVVLIDNFHANRYAYLPYVGLFLILGVFVERLLQKAPDLNWRSGFAGALALVFVFFSVLTVMRANTWDNTNTIMSDSIAKEPDVAFVHNSRGIWRTLNGDQEGAIADLTTALRIDPTFSLAYYYLGNAKYELQRYQEAKTDYDKNLAVLWDFGKGYLGRGKTNLALRDLSAALADLNEAIRYDPTLIEAYYHRGLVLNQQGDFANARTDLDQAIAMFPTYADAFTERGKAKAGTGDQTGACADWKEAARLGSVAASTAMSGCPA